MDEHPARLSREILDRFLAETTREICKQIESMAIVYRNAKGEYLAEDKLGGCHSGQRFTRGVNIPWEVLPYLWDAEAVYRSATGEDLVYQHLGRVHVSDVLTFKCPSEDDFHAYL
jgi:hypothetical protein